jgi:hypothetical protein
LVAAASFLLGAAPLVVYNVHNHLETFRGNAKIAPSRIWPKTLMVRNTLNGSGLFGYIVHEEYDDSPRSPQNTLERFSTRIRQAAGYHREGWLGQLMLFSLACLPFWISQWRVVCFALITALVAWLLMAANEGTGGSVHHVVLLWPAPQFIAAFCLGAAVANRRAVWRWLAAAVVVLVCGQNVLVINQYLYNALRTGPGLSWTDAIFPLKDALVRLHPEHIDLMDWGTEFNLLALTSGNMDLRWAGEAGVREIPTDYDQRLMTVLLEQAPESIWVRHVIPIEVTSGASERFDKRAVERGYIKRPLEVVRDRNGRNIFEIYRFVKVNP